MEDRQARMAPLGHPGLPLMILLKRLSLRRWLPACLLVATVVQSGVSQLASLPADNW